MKRKELILIVLLFGSIIVTQIHKLLDNNPVNEVDWLLFVDLKQDVQWYVCHTGKYISSLLLFIAVYKLLPYKLKPIGIGLIIGCILDIANYWVFYHQFDWIYKSLIIIIPTLLIILKHEKRNNNRASH